MTVLGSGEITVASGFYAGHKHSFWEIVLTLDGGGTAYLGSRTERFTPGTVLVIPPGLSHSKSSEASFRESFLHLGNAFPLPAEILRLQDGAEKSFEKLIALVAALGGSLARAPAAEALRRLIIERSGPPNVSGRRDVGAVLALLCENYTNPEFRLEDALGHVSYNPDYFRRCFRAEAGASPGEYLRNLRLDHAAALLRQRGVFGLSVSEVAMASGFYDTNYFARAFKKKYGTSPSEFGLGLVP